MLVALLARVLAQLFLVACFAAGMVAAFMIFIAYGPVPVRRKVTLVPRLEPRDPFADQPAARIVSLPQHAQVHFSAPVAVAPIAPVAVTPIAPVAVTPVAVAPIAPVAPPRSPEPQVTPLVLRRPRGTTPPPLPRSRSARGTERRTRPSELELQDRTDQIAPVQLDDDAFLEDGR